MAILKRIIILHQIFLENLAYLYFIKEINKIKEVYKNRYKNILKYF